jgi:hypothetical protein
MPRLDIPIRKTSAIFVRRVITGREQFVREPYNVVSLNFGDGTDVQTYVEPTCGVARSPSEREEKYDEVRFYDSPPFPGTRIGYGNPGT